MSSFKVEVVAIDEVSPHAGADRLELAKVKGWNVVVGKNAFKAGELAIYIPVDSVLPESLENTLFPPDSKIKLHKHRIRSIKIRGAVSQGMLVSPSEVGLRPGTNLFVGDDVAEILGIKKYEPPEPEYQLIAGIRTGFKRGNKGQINPNFSKYTDIENIKNYPDVFNEGEIVYISEKLHGTSARYGYVPRHYEPTFFGRVRRLFDSALITLGWGDTHQFVYGSRNVQLQTGQYRSWYENDVYAKIGKQCELMDKLKPGECVYGEIVGDRIQTNYTYGCKPGEHKFFAYDVRIDGRWLDFTEFVDFCYTRGIPRVPELYVGPYSKEIELKYRDGDSTIGGQKIREGVVIKPIIEEVAACGRKVLKSISDAYYLEENSDFH